VTPDQRARQGGSLSVGDSCCEMAIGFLTPGGGSIIAVRRQRTRVCRSGAGKNGVSGGNGTAPSNGNGIPPMSRNGNGRAQSENSDENDRFVIGYAVENLRWCSAKTEVICGELESTQIEDYDYDEELCGTDAIQCGRRLMPRAMTPHFVDTFRMSAVYINLFRDTTFVIHIPGALAEEPLFESVMEDIATLSIIGIKIVLVLGPKRQIDKRISESNMEEVFHNGLRVTDAPMLRLIKEATGHLLFEVESKLSRGVVNVPTKNKINTVSGNFYSAQPVGVIDGKDLGFTGRVRKIDVEAIERRLNERDVVVLSNIAFSPSGESFNCQSESVAAACAAQLKAEKLIYLGGYEVLYDSATNAMVPNLPLRTAKMFFEDQGYELPANFKLRLGESISALSQGVRRAHILNRFVNGVLLMEIFHRDGVGIMVSRDLYEGVRSARLSDLPGIFEIIEPLMEAKVLVARSREQLEREIGNMIVAERDGMVIALAMLATYPSNPDIAELACFAVHPQYRRSGKGASLLSYVERTAYAMGIRRLFLLSTQSFAWFRERKFFEVSLDNLPECRRQKYNHERKSKVLMKEIVQSDELEELLIQVQD